QIDHLLDTRELLSAAELPARRMAFHLRQFYHQSSPKQHDVLERAWEEIVARYQTRQALFPDPGKAISMQNASKELQARKQRQTTSGTRTFARRIGMLAAIAMIALLVGSMAFLLDAARQGKSVPPITRHSSQTGSGGTPLPKPPHPITGGACTIDTTRPHPQQ